MPVMDLLPPELQDISVLRRVIFAVGYLPEDMPLYWEVVAQFASSDIKPDSIKIAVENLKMINNKVFSSDYELAKEIHGLYPNPVSSKLPSPLGIVLISSKSACRLCGDILLLRSDRPSNITAYTDSWGTAICTQYHKFCRNFRKGCSLQQYYGYSSEKNGVQLYDKDWSTQKYFISSNDTAFELTFLKRLDAELLLGQISYSQSAEIFNYNNGYPVQPKKCSTVEKDELPKPPRYVRFKCT